MHTLQGVHDQLIMNLLSRSTTGRQLQRSGLPCLDMSARHRYTGEMVMLYPSRLWCLHLLRRLCCAIEQDVQSQIRSHIAEHL